MVRISLFPKIVGEIIALAFDSIRMDCWLEPVLSSNCGFVVVNGIEQRDEFWPPLHNIIMMDAKLEKHCTDSPLKFMPPRTRKTWGRARGSSSSEISNGVTARRWSRSLIKFCILDHGHTQFATAPSKIISSSYTTTPNRARIELRRELISINHEFQQNTGGDYSVVAVNNADIVVTTSPSFPIEIRERILFWLSIIVNADDSLSHSDLKFFKEILH